MVSTYELAVLYHPDLEIDLEKAETKVTKLITDNGGKVESIDNWGKRKTAYPVKGHEHAVYAFYTVSMPGANVMKLEGILNITDEVIRFLITKPDTKAIATAAAHKAKRKLPEGSDQKEQGDRPPRRRREDDDR